MKNSNLVGLFLVWYYSELEQLGASKNQVNKYFHTIFSPGEVSVELVKAEVRLLYLE
jgi:hypothetical protein